MFVNTLCGSWVKHKGGGIGESGALSSSHIPVPVGKQWLPTQPLPSRHSAVAEGEQPTVALAKHQQPRGPKGTEMGQNLFVQRETGDSSRNPPQTSGAGATGHVGKEGAGKEE